MEFDNLELSSAEDFVSLTSKNNELIYYNFAKFRLTNFGPPVYLKRKMVYMKSGSSQLESVSPWELITENDFYDAKNEKYGNY